jgi:hypothetical protein
MNSMKPLGFYGETHELKTDPEPFNEVWNGRKLAEFRENDRDFRVGDALILREYDRTSGTYLGRRIRASISHALYGPDYGIPAGYAMLSMQLEWRGNDGGETPYR